MLKEEIKNINTDKKELRKFGITIGIVLLSIGLFLYFYHQIKFGSYLSGFGFLLFLIGIISPDLLKHLYKNWMILALLLGFVMTRVILSFLFYVVVTPIGLIAKLVGKDFLFAKIEKNKSSYWNYREKEEYQKIFTERQF